MAPAHVEVFGDRLEAIGTLSANESSMTVTSKAQGIIRTLNFDDGQSVNKVFAEEIAIIDPGRTGRQAGGRRLANLEEQRKTLERIHRASAYAATMSTQAALDTQVAAVKKAEANVAALPRGVHGIRDYRIWAPSPRRTCLGTRRISVGALVSPGTAVATLDDISVVKLDFAIPESFLAVLRSRASISKPQSQRGLSR